MEYYFNILYYLNIYKKWWKIITKSIVIAIFFTALVSFIAPRSYISTVTIISSDSGVSAVSSLSKFLGVSNFLNSSSSNDIVIAILKSKRMENDINAFLALNKQVSFKYNISANTTPSGLIINIKGNNPIYTEKVANFTILNLDKINSELNLTPNKPMVKVLDPAIYGIPEGRKILQKIIIAGVLTFLIISLWIFLSDYIKKIKLLSIQKNNCV
jgi:uncharacterized protein involved in exopolysaccharide biosynthesis